MAKQLSQIQSQGPPLTERIEILQRYRLDVEVHQQKMES